MQPPPATPLQALLESLADRCEAIAVFVSDTSGWVISYASSRPAGWEETCAAAVPRVMDQVRAEGHADLFHGGEAPYVAARSFGGVYVLTAVFDAEFPEAVIRAMFRQALPAIAAIVASLPPDRDPTRGAKRLPSWRP